jgi:hypothetical protein
MTKLRNSEYRGLRISRLLYFSVKILHSLVGSVGNLASESDVVIFVCYSGEAEV